MGEISFQDLEEMRDSIVRGGLQVDSSWMISHSFQKRLMKYAIIDPPKTCNSYALSELGIHF